MLIRIGLLALLAALLPAGAAPVADARRIQEKLIAPCCWSESVAVHRSEPAARMRIEIEQMVRSGLSEEQIIARYVAQHGERILLEPRGGKFTWLMITPVFALAAGGYLLARYLRRPRAPEPVAGDTGAVLPGNDVEW
ncbi:MAG: cytochrome c-type biogenesis protein CcmH [Candidatus Solibacter usitatus]|nr:cytochrome c-type biogenesis protein CcmH [Candidatus Solibacter usitatus]